MVFRFIERAMDPWYWRQAKLTKSYRYEVGERGERRFRKIVNGRTDEPVDRHWLKTGEWGNPNAAKGRGPIELDAGAMRTESSA